MDYKNLQKFKPGWYMARDNKCPWWNLFVCITFDPPFKGLRISPEGAANIIIHPEEIGEISGKTISFKEFEVIQELQKTTRLPKMR